MGIALQWNELPIDLIESNLLHRRAHDRGGEREIRFLHAHAPRLIPAWIDGEIRLVRWGTAPGESRRLPATAWTWQQSIDDGKWQNVPTRFVDIPANYGVDKGVWYRVRQGMRGLLVDDEWREPVVYMICIPATRYYRIMTRSARMPLLIDEWI